MKWRQATEKDFHEDWMFGHYRYKKDGIKLDTDLFDVVHDGLIKRGGTGGLYFHEIEILDETPSTPANVGIDFEKSAMVTLN